LPPSRQGQLSGAQQANIIGIRVAALSRNQPIAVQQFSRYIIWLPTHEESRASSHNTAPVLSL